jgi:hypothetical protein
MNMKKLLRAILLAWGTILLILVLVWLVARVMPPS